VTVTGGTWKSFSITPTYVQTPVAVEDNWDPGSYATATLSDGATEDVTVNNISGSIVAKYERRGATVETPGLLAHTLIENSPRPWEREGDPTTTATTHTETGRFNFANKEFYLEYSIVSSLVPVTVRGQQILVPLGGVLEMTNLRKDHITITLYEGKQYNVWDVNHRIVFKYPGGERQFPSHSTQVADPR